MGIIDGVADDYFFRPTGRRERFTISTIDQDGMYVDILTNHQTSETTVLRIYPKPLAQEGRLDRTMKYLGFR